MTIAFTVDASEWSALVDKLEGLSEAVISEVRTAVHRSMAVIETYTVGFTPIGATGNLAQSWQQSPIKQSRTFVRGEVASTLIYAPVVERGRRPGSMPPTDAIRTWVIRKGIAPSDKADAVAYLIARKIGERGTKAQPMLEPAVNRSIPTIRRELDAALERALRTLAE